jgi:hypothetical protein
MLGGDFIAIKLNQEYFELAAQFLEWQKIFLEGWVKDFYQALK